MKDIMFMSTGTQVFIIGFVVFVFTVIKMNKLHSDDPSNIDLRQIISLRYDMFTAVFFMVGSLFF